MTNSDGTLSDRRAIEALRAGVPNGDAVRALSSGQPDVIKEFERKLSIPSDLRSEESTGFVISGGFGTGKSHLVEELHQLALAQGFVSSKVIISKETPLHLPARVVSSAVNAMEAGNKPDGVLLDMITRLQSESSEVLDFERWCGTRGSRISGMFRTLLQLRARRAHDLDCVDLLLRYFSGETVPIGTIRRQLREAGVDASVEVVPAVDRPWQNVRFLARFCQAAGYKGWVIFLDEAELISKYGPLSRARAYEQLGRWLGLLPSHRISGITVVATVIEDFIHGVLPNDRWQVAEILGRGRRLSDVSGVQFANKAIGAIEDALHLEAFTQAHLQIAHDTLRKAHSRAYSWEAPALHTEYRRHRPMRMYVRRWINEWDLSRLFGDRSLEFSGEKIDIDLSTDPELEDGPELERGHEA